ncbi:MAG: hypothetical protein AAF962_26660 [Actinomycetota bacterium]
MYRTPRRPAWRATPTAALVGATLLALAVIGVAGAANADRLVSPETSVAAPAAGSAVVGGDLVAVGLADHERGVAGVRVVVKNLDDDTYWNGTDWQRGFVRAEASLDTVGAHRVSWTVRVPEAALVDGAYRVRGFAVSIDGNGDAHGGDLQEFTYRAATPPADAPQPPAPSEPAPPTTAPPATTPPDLVPPTTAPPVTTEPGATATPAPPTTAPTSTSTPCGKEAKLVPCSGILTGSTGDFAAADGVYQSQHEDFLRQEEALGADFDVFHEYNQWNDLVRRAWPRPDTAALADDGRIIFANWKSPTGRPADWARIAAGDYDDDIRAAAAQIRAFEDPVFLAFFHEPEDNIKSAAGGDQAIEDQLVADYAAATTRLREVFDAEGTTNAVWVWNIQGWSGHHRLYDAGLYPGDDVIDWVAYNAYNWHGCDNHGDRDNWTSVGDVYRPFYEWMNSPGPNRPGADRPVMLGEWGTEENSGASNSDQTKAEWIDDFRTRIPADFDRIKAVIYFDTEGRRSNGSVQFCLWGLDSSPDSLAAFQRLMNDRAFIVSWA